MRKYLVLIILLFSLQIVTAASVQFGEIKLTVENRAPELKSLQILPEEPHYDSILECNPDVWDETPDTLTYTYEWYKNDIKLEETSSTITEIKDNDIIRCTLFVVDSFGESSEKKTAEIIILESPIRVRIIKPILTMAGIEITAKEIKESTNMNAITGMVSGERETSDITLIFVLGIFMFLLILINAIGLTIRFKRKIKSPKQGYQHA